MLETWPREVDWEEVQRAYAPPPELAWPAPREAAPRDPAGTSLRAKTGNSCLGCALLPMFLIGVMLAWWGGLAAFLVLFGAPATGRITEREPFSGRRDATYYLRFRFHTVRGEASGEWLVRPDFWRRVRVGDKVKVRYFPLAPGLRPMLEEGLSPWTAILGWGPFGLLLMGIAGVPLAGLFWPRRGKRLVKRGLVAPAFVCARDLERGELEFLLLLPGARVVEVKTKTTRAHLLQLGVGSTRAALYFSARPNRAQLYETLDWKALPPRKTR